MWVNAMTKALIIGASSAIARALIDELESQGTQVHSVSRSRLERERHSCLAYSEQAIANWCLDAQQQGLAFEYIYICNGVLHSEEVQPEKSLSAFSQSAFFEVMQCNTVVPMWWLSNLTKLLTPNAQSVVTILSARVGSITDNRLGGWYSYRASKAALNMLTKTTAIEMRRTHKHSKFLLFHPGTTDSDLSKPFQKNVPAGKLFTPHFVARRLRELSTDYAFLPSCGFYDWNRQAIEF
ncbi:MULTISPECIES: SDR family NAD(P)-dependent oxidoreductase [unclassified Pseudoalteromonas]|uniref:SDR family NAD(P)-dependent oxidoreductase n=1 Tax=unclassified Pseudoalteromonas TaxID=194690 RepID=UPI000CF69690|nr:MULTISPECIES: SDR family NAD(P)-dependent oxidoreductase [unclassified Pseudoalteromonas]MBS3797733.1 SDR family NAD(P)-dependent oxidoreductase [Pseudoalteromonas sp. BDTF-M6]